MDEGTIKQLRNDGLMNAINATGTRKDPASHYKLKPSITFPTPESYEIIYMADPLIQRIVDMIADEAVKNWISLEDNKGASDKVLGILEDLDTEACFADALRWRNLFGGGAILMRINDGRSWLEPLNMDNIKEVENLRPLDMTDIRKVPGGTYQDTDNPNYGQQEFYDVLPENEGGTPFRVHETRILVFPGERLPRHTRLLYPWQWGKSVAAAVYDAVIKFNRSNEAGLNALERISQLVVGIPNLSDVLAMDDGEKKVAERIDLIDMTRSILNSIVIDAAEQVQLLNAQLTRVPEVMAHVWQITSTVSEIPVTKLFGQAPAGFNSTGESDLENWYSKIRKDQNRVVRKPAERIIKIVYLSQNGPTNGVEPEWKMTFNPLWVPSQKEQAETYKAEAEADAVYLTNNVLYPEEVRAKLKTKGIQTMDEFDNMEIKPPKDE